MRVEGDAPIEMRITVPVALEGFETVTPRLPALPTINAALSAC